MMKNNKIIPLNKKQQKEHDDIEIIDEINKGLEKVDSTYQTYTPNVQWFEQMIIKEKEIARKKLIKELVLFFLIAILIVSLLVISIFQAPLIFLIVQLAVAIGLPLGVYIHYKRQVVPT